ncbi:MAG: c-type cytochrome [Candidatus Acidiferrales bacterium]
MLALVFVIGISAGIAEGQTGPPPWAYGFAYAGGPVPPSGSESLPKDDSPKHLPGSKFSFALQEIWNQYSPADWYPEDHPPMPDIVAHGHKPSVRACSFCHYPNGKGRSENAGVAGLPFDYFVKTMHDFRNGARQTANQRRLNANYMIQFANGMTDEDIAAAAKYFGSMKWTPWIKVVETQMAPKTRILGHMFVALDGDEKEPLGNRIIEVPENTDATVLFRDDHSGFIAYVPIGSVKKGEALVTSGGNGKTIPCGTCHGSKMEGLGAVPPLAGRSPSYLMRQLYDIRQGDRTGAGTELMKPVVAHLNEDDMLAIVAYLASLAP